MADGVDQRGDLFFRVGDFGSVSDPGNPIPKTTPKYTPPEALQRGKKGKQPTVDYSFDKFSLGWVIRDLRYGTRIPAEHQSDDSVYPELDPSDPDDQIILALLDPDPTKRPDLNKTLTLLERRRDSLPQHAHGARTGPSVVSPSGSPAPSPLDVDHPPPSPASFITVFSAP